MNLDPETPSAPGGSKAATTKIFETAGAGDQPQRPSAGWYRWVICALLFFATTINYIDRQVIGILKPVLTEQLGWSEIDYGNIIFAFQAAYAAGYLLAGRLIDRIGVRVGYGLAVVLWSLAAMGHSFARSLASFYAARFSLGLAEGGNFPAVIKSISEWFPKNERALATGIVNSGTNVGALVTPLLVPWLTVKFGWPAAFLITGGLGFVWLIAWWLVYQNPEVHSRVTPAELNYIRSDPPDPDVKISWLELLQYRQTWAFIVGMFLSSPIWWFYLYWIPDFLHKQHGLNLLQLGPPLVTIYLMTDVGSIGGGWLSSWLIKRGWTVNAARKTTMLACALCVVPVFAASMVSQLWVATILIGLAASAHQGFSANLYTLVSDTAPRQVVSSIVGIGGMAGAIGGMFIAKLAGHILQWTGSYLPLFIIAASAYLINLLIIHLLNPRLEPMKFVVSEDGKT
jgi:ACS family hexuronate transporter-like MFS transporter